MAAFAKELIKNRLLIWEMAKKDAKSRYLGSALGFLWAFIHPIIAILIYWFVFQVGFRSLPVENFPFFLWLMMGMIPWLFVSESVSNSTNSIVDNSYLVKKIVFRVSLLPFIKIISSLFVHLFFLLVLLIVYFIYDFDFTVYLFQIFYYILATVFLVVGISFITATLNVFFRDTGQVVGMIINFLFWLTPIFWSMDIVNEKYKTLFKINPLYYIVEGYRDTFINHRWFWEVPGLTIYFWCVTVCTILIGAALFRKLRPHFADVL